MHAGSRSLEATPINFFSIVLTSPDKKPVSPEEEPEQPPSPPPPKNTRRSLWKDIEAIGKQVFTLYNLINVKSVPKVS